MALEQTARDTVEAVVVDDGRLLLVDASGGRRLPSGPPELAERPQATAARVVYELTGYLVDGFSLLEPEGEEPSGPVAGRSTVVCRLLSDTPSPEARLTAEQVHWTPFAQAVDAGLPAGVPEYLEGRTSL
ncbi:NUDIX domain-containing protein [Streptomyces sp. NPDC048566]|uniref:NUDIX domain-containing protein n=1 Tax=Streptomyces sp. NPDC048566 TaxID=3365569 RepID=UPI00371C512D